MARPTTSATDLVKMLNAATLPIYVLDEARCIRFANHCLLDWVGSTAEEVVGLVCNYHSDAEPAGAPSLGTGLCPPPAAFTGQRSRAVVACHCRDGQLVRRWADFTPLIADEIDCPGVIVLVDRDDFWGEFEHPQREPRPTELHELVRDFQQAERGRFSLGQLVGTSPAIRRVRSQVRLAAQATANVLIVGSPGSGREHVARTIYHAEQYRFERQILLPIECGLVDGDILQSTVRAFQQRAADLGEHGQATLLLLDVERLSREAERVLWDHVNVPSLTWRLMSTARNPRLSTDDGEDQAFDDLRCLLSTLVIELPRLVERSEDIPPLAQLFLEKLNAEGAKQVGGFSPEALDQLRLYSWPNNTDELIGMIRQSHDRAEGPLVGKSDLPRRITVAADAAAVARHQTETIELDAFMAEIEVELMRRALQQAKGNKAAAARSLGISRQRLLRRWQQFESDPNGRGDGRPVGES